MFGKVFHILTGRTAAMVMRAIGDLLMPRECIVCGRPLLSHEKHLCTWCLSDLPLTYFWLQPRNAMADKFNLMVQRQLESEITMTGGKGHGTPPAAYVPAAALFFYRSGTGYEKITQSLKYHADIPAGRYFARLLAERLKDSPHLSKDSPYHWKADAVVPVPLHWTRRWKRGYNQAETIASQLVESGIGGTMIPNLLVRNRRTRTQTKMAVGQKSENVRGAFSINPEIGPVLKGKLRSILLVDDVFTTGATMHECWETLMEWDSELRIIIVTLGYVG